MDNEIRQAAETIRRDSDLAYSSARTLYWTMVGQQRAANALEVFAKANAIPLIRQGLMTDNWDSTIGAATYFERTGDKSALPELVNALERNNYEYMEGLGEEEFVHAILQQGLVRAIGSVTGLNDVASKSLPEKRSQQTDHQVISGFLKQVRQWAGEHTVELFPPAEIQEPPRTRPLEVEEQVDVFVRDLGSPDKAVSQNARARLQAVRDHIDKALSSGAPAAGTKPPASQ